LKKKVLIITYYWPPSGGPGVQRVLKFAKYLPAMDWEPIILTVKDGEYPAIDPSLEKEIAPDLVVHKIESLEFFDLFRKLTGRRKEDKIDTYELVKGKDQLSWKDRLAQFVRQNLLLPDARIGWYLRGYKESLKIVREINPDIIFSSSPPHSLQLLARKLSKSLGIKWVADFRDPWTKSFYDKGAMRWKIAEKWNHRMEQSVVRSADCITSVSKGVLELLGDENSRQSAVLPNGFDADDFHHVKEGNDVFTVVYTGHVASVQNPESFFKAISKIESQVGSTLKVDFYGSVDREVVAAAERNNIQHLVTFNPYVSHVEVTNIMVQADMLLLLIPKHNSKGILTGKLFEYLATGNFILGIGPPNGIASTVISDCQAGKMIDYDDDFTSVIMDQYDQWRKGLKHVSNSEKINQYSRKEITRNLANLFEDLCG